MQPPENLGDEKLWIDINVEQNVPLSKRQNRVNGIAAQKKRLALSKFDIATIDDLMAATGIEVIELDAVMAVLGEFLKS